MTLRSKKGWFIVNDVTSLTKEEKNGKQQRAKIANAKQNAMWTYQEDFPDEKAKQCQFVRSQHSPNNLLWKADW